MRLLEGCLHEGVTGLTSIQQSSRSGIRGNHKTRRSHSPRAARLGLALAGLAFTQIAGWGALLFMPAILGRAIQSEMAISAEMAFGAVGLMYVIGALFAPLAGTLIDRHGAAWIMAAGSLAASIGLMIMSQATGLWAYLLAWTILGLTSAAALSNASYAAIAQIAGSATIRAVTILMFATGLAGTISMPIILALSEWTSWRGICLIFALTHGLICLPIHVLTLRREGHAAPSIAPNAEPAECWPAQLHRTAFIWLSAALALNIFITSGMALHLVGLLMDSGLGKASAVLVASLIGPVQVATRAMQIALPARYAPRIWAVAGATFIPLGALLLLGAIAANAQIMIAAVLFVVLMGISNGLMVVARAAVPLEIFGGSHYGHWTGWLAVSQNIATAMTPLAFAAMLNHGGAIAALMLALASGTISLAALIRLSALKRHAASQPAESASPKGDAKIHPAAE